MQLRVDFETVEDAIAYLKGDVQNELTRLEAVEAEEKPALLRKRDELLTETRAAKTRAAELEAELAKAQGRAAELESQVKGTVKTEDEIQAQYRSAYEKDKSEFQKQLDALKAERETEKAEAEKAKLRAAAIAELSKPNHRLHNPEHFYRLHGEKITRDPDTGELYVDMGDYKRQPIATLIEDIEQRPEEQHLFKPKGGSGSGSPGSGNPSSGNGTGANPFKTGNLTEQMKLFKANRPLYDRLKAEAGK